MGEAERPVRSRRRRRDEAKVAFVLTRIEPGVEFVDRARLPLATIAFRHVYRPEPQGGGRITHEVSITGPLALLFGCTLGRKIAKHLRAAMSTLSDQAAAEPLSSAACPPVDAAPDIDAERAAD
jgi:hypothetical protein